MTFRIIQGDNRETLKTIPDDSVDAIVTDPPYGISFLGKDWDSFRNSRVTKNSTVQNLGSGMRMTTTEENVNFQLWCEDWARECFRVLKPGGYLLSFCAARMYHRMTVGLEDAGFEIRDQIMWIYSSGFPKSQDVGRSLERSINKKLGKQNKIKKTVDTTKNVGFGQTDHARVRAGEQWSTPSTEVGIVEITHPEAQQWAGWGTSLKPAHEPIALARKPLTQSIAKNMQQWGTGALNIDSARVPYEDQSDIETYLNNKRGPMERGSDQDGRTIRMFDGETGFKAVKRPVTEEQDLPELGRFPSNVLGEIPDYQKYFYCPKVSRRERHLGFDLTTISTQPEGKFDRTNDPGNGNERILNKGGNNHPTVKPVALMEYLIKLVTPPGGTVLDPFNGSGSTGMAAVGLGYDYIGCELDPAYVTISERRIRAWLADRDPIRASGLFEECP